MLPERADDFAAIVSPSQSSKAWFASAPRSFDAISNALAEALTTVSPTECANYVANAGYAST